MDTTNGPSTRGIIPYDCALPPIVEGLGLWNVRVVRQANAGKSAALNHGISLAHSDIIIMIDGDTVLEPDTVRRIVQPFADPSVGAVAGNTKIANRRSIVAAWQHIEYVIGSTWTAGSMTYCAACRPCREPSVPSAVPRSRTWAA